MRFALALLLLLAGAGTANADPLSAAIGLLSGAAGFSGGITGDLMAASGIITTFHDHRYRRHPQPRGRCATKAHLQAWPGV